MVSIILFFAVVFLQCCYVLSEWDTQDYLKREHTLVKPYQGSGMNVPLWDFQGNTIVTNNYIRLTSDSQSKQGAIWNSIPVYVRNWELHVHFKVHGHGKDLFGDGIAIWYTRDRLQPGQVFGNKDYFMGLAIFLDTYSNHNGPHNHAHPWVSAMVNNGSLHYDHDRDGTHTMVSGAGCESQFRNKDHETYIAIRYSNNILKVSMDIDGKNIWKECFIVMGVRLPTGYFFGVSAATGELADNHDVISLKLYELDSPDDPDDDTDYARIIPSAEEIVAPRDRVDDVKGSYVLGQMSGWKLLLIIILIIIGVCVCAVVGYIVFQRQQESSRKRFY